MADLSLDHRRILVAEDEFLLADDLDMELQDAGAIVLGPAGTISEALKIIEDQQQIDGAILDVNLGGDAIFPAAEALMKRQVPFVFTTGYDPSSIPERYRAIVRFEKPIILRHVVSAVGRLVSGEGVGANLAEG